MVELNYKVIYYDDEGGKPTRQTILKFVRENDELAIDSVKTSFEAALFNKAVLTRGDTIVMFFTF